MTISASFQALLQTLQTIVGPAHVLIESADNDLVQYVRDWRGRERGVALAVVRPNSTEQVAAIVKACAASNKAGSGVSIVPQGGNTGLVGGAIPALDCSAVLLSLARLDRIRAVDAAGLTLTAEAGVVLSQVHDAARAVACEFPLTLAAKGSATKREMRPLSVTKAFWKALRWAASSPAAGGSSTPQCAVIGWPGQ